MIHEITPSPSNPHLPIVQFGDQIHFLNPSSGFNWIVTYDTALLQYIGTVPLSNPGDDGWRFVVINSSAVPTIFTIRATPGPPLNRNVVIDEIVASLLEGTASFSVLIEGIASTASVEPEDFVPFGPRAFQRGAFQMGAFQ